MSETTKENEDDTGKPGPEGHPQRDPEREAVEAEARRQGWRPKEEFSGGGAWVDAPEFVERGKQFQSILKRENRELRDRLAEMETRSKETGDVIKEFREQTAQRERRAYERGKQDLQAQIDAAAASGDMDGYRRGQRQMEQLENEHKPDQRKEPTPPPPAAETAKAPVDPTVVQWGRENPWFNTDPEANAYAQAMHVQIGNSEPNLTLRENLDEVRRRVVRRFPELFGNVRRDAPPPVGRPNGGGKQPKKEKGFDDLPAEAKIACDRFVKQGLFKSRDEYCKNFEWDTAA